MRTYRLSLLGLIAGFCVAGLALSSTGVPAQPVGPPNEIWCNRTGIATSGPATVSVVAGVTGRTTSVCGFIASATAAATIQLITGTGATCGTGTVNLTAAHAIPAGAFINYGGNSAFSSAATGANLCAIIGGTGPVQLTVVYSQF